MEIKTTYKDRSGSPLPLVYRDVNSEDELEGKSIQSVHAFCFCGDKFLVVYSAKKDTWTPPGGGVEVGESISRAVLREVKEESNMRGVHKD